eukprot:TRINITY_DN11532_c0_g1_i1.p1 TRINITY_DN11532_c0_g1~~TRINITY_DN11532_c0_g1_i1.p1  ORF type:complete len:1074 (-),score=187.32 TRINITY_DN11532_c0_g1_i1:49-3153(-)
MPTNIVFDWSEDEGMLYFILHVRGVTAKSVDISLCDVFVKVNCHPSLFEVDLLKEIDPDDPKTRCRVGAGKVTLNLKKKCAGLWNEFRATGSKAELRLRRRKALDNAEAREQERLQKRDDRKSEKLKAGEHEQWRLDRENREQVDKWEEEEKRKWEEDMYASFDETTKAAVCPPQLPLVDGDLDAPEKDEDVLARPAEATGGSPEVLPSVSVPSGATGGAPVSAELSLNSELQPTPKVCEVTDEEAARIRSGESSRASAQKLVKPEAGKIWTSKDLDDTEEFFPDVRDNPGKVGIRFSTRPRAGVPVRDRGANREPPHPKGTVKSDLPPMIAGDDDRDEQDPVWLKEKADNLMVAGDYQGAHNAYTLTLKIAPNARAFANRAVADLYLGNLEACIEDCGHSLKVLDMRCRAPPGHMPPPADPQDQLVRGRVEVRMATAYLWLGAFGKAEEHYQKALDAENAWPEYEDKKIVQDDLARVQAARAALPLKEKADTALRRAYGVGDREKAALDTALRLYEEAIDAGAGDIVALRANMSFARLRAGQVDVCLDDAKVIMDCLKRWPAASRAPKAPPRPTRLDPPYLDDPTFIHPNEAKQGEVDWLMKHSGGTTDNLPPLPPEYEWVKDAAEKNDNAWIAVRKKMTKAIIDTIKRHTGELQDAVYARNPRYIREQLLVSLETNRVGEGPSDKAIRQAQEYATKLEEYEKERESEREQENNELKQEFEDCDLEQAFSSVKSGIGQMGFGRGHPVEKTRRRLYVKTLLRRARVYELLGDAQGGITELNAVLRAEPENPEAKKRLAILSTPPAPLVEAPQSKTASAITKKGRLSAAPASAPSSTKPGLAAAANSPSVEPATGKTPHASSASTAAPAVDQRGSEKACLDGEDDDKTGIDYAAITQLIHSAGEYMRRNDYSSALQIYNYAQGQCKEGWASQSLELRLLSNKCLCLQRLRGRLPELISACNEVMRRISEIRTKTDVNGDVSEETLLHMESACLSRRGSALAQLNRAEESAEDAARVRQVMGRVKELDAERQSQGQ